MTLELSRLNSKRYTDLSIGVIIKYLIQFRGDMETKVFLTIIVLVILNQYAKEFKTEWSLMTRKSRKFIKSAALSPDRIGKVESDLRNFINKTN